LAFLLLLDDDLGQHRAGDLFAGLGVKDHKILAAFDHRGEVFERDVGAGASVVEPPVGVFLDSNGLGRLGRCGVGHCTVRLGTFLK
jgi:hypothetical protein